MHAAGGCPVSAFCNSQIIGCQNAFEKTPKNVDNFVEKPRRTVSQAAPMRECDKTLTF